VNFAPAPAPAPRRAHRPLTVRLPTSVLRRNARAKNNFSAASAAGFSASRGAEDPAALFETIRSCDAISSAAVSATIVSAPCASLLYFTSFYFLVVYFCFVFLYFLSLINLLCFNKLVLNYVNGNRNSAVY
jgi:hypothetical protein